MYTQIKEDFRSVRPLWKFISFALLSGGFYPIHWIMRFLEVLNDKYDVSKERTKIALYFIWASIVCIYLLTPIAENLFYDSLLFHNHAWAMLFSNLTVILALLSFLFAMIFALLAKKVLEEVFEKRRIDRPLSTLWALVFNYFYFYYVLHSLGKNRQG